MEAVTGLLQQGTREQFRREGLDWLYEPMVGEEPVGLVFRASYLRRSGGDLTADVQVTANLPGVPRQLLRHRVNVSGPNGRRDLSRALCDSAGHSQRPPPALEQDAARRLVENFCSALMDAENAAGEVIVTGNQPLPARVPDLVEKLVQAQQINTIFGPEGTGKSYLLLALALCMQNGLPFCGLRVRQANVLVLDWEGDWVTFLRRVKAVRRGLGLPDAEVAWMGPRGTLPRVLRDIARQVQQHQITCLIYDSAGHAFGSPAEHGTWEDVALVGFEAMKALGPDLTHVLIDHVSGEGRGQKLAGKALGAVRKIADARVAWEIRKDQESEQDAYRLGLYHQKHNNTRKFAPIALRLAFQNDPDGWPMVASFSRTDVHDSLALASALPLTERILRALARGWTPTATVAEMVGESDVLNVAATLRYLRTQRRTVSREPDGKTGRGHVVEWGLALPETPLNGKGERRTPLSTYSGSPFSEGGVDLPSTPPNESEPQKANKGEPVRLCGRGRFPGDQDEDAPSPPAEPDPEPEPDPESDDDLAGGAPW